MEVETIKKSLSRLGYLLDKIKKNNRKEFDNWNSFVEEDMPSLMHYYKYEEKSDSMLKAVTNMYNFDFSLLEDIKKAKAMLNEIIKYGFSNNQLKVEQIKSKLIEDVQRVESKIQSIERYGNISTRTEITLNYK